MNTPFGHIWKQHHPATRNNSSCPSPHRSLRNASFLVKIVEVVRRLRTKHFKNIMSKACSTSVVLLLMIASLWHDSFSQQPLLSPRDSVELSFAGKTISINYGRPSMRGRKIMGGLVPYNKWWRTGANEATSFVTQMDLIVGGEMIPKGAYTLYTMPSAKQWKLIINKQTGQWGTVYNPELDLARIHLNKKMLKKPVEKFTITLEKSGKSSGVIRLVWEKTDLSVSFRVNRDSSPSSR